MNLLKAVSSALSRVEGILTALLLAAMILLAFLQVVLRNLFSTGILWLDPFLRHMVLWLGFLGASLATRQEKHINLDVLTRLMSPRGVEFARTASNLFAGAVCAALARAGLTFVRNEIGSGEELLHIGDTVFPAWWFQTIIPAGFALMAFRFAIRAAEHLIRSMHPPEAVEHTTNVPTLEP